MTLYREISLTLGENSESDEPFALRDRLGPDAMEVLSNLTQIGSALSEIILPGAALAVYVEYHPEDDEKLLVRLIGLEPVEK